MLRVVVDPNVVVSAAISPGGVTGRLLRLGLAGQFRVVVCPMLLQEAADALARPKLQRFVSIDAALELVLSETTSYYRRRLRMRHSVCRFSGNQTTAEKTTFGPVQGDRTERP